MDFFLYGATKFVSFISLGCCVTQSYGMLRRLRWFAYLDILTNSNSSLSNFELLSYKLSFNVPIFSMKHFYLWSMVIDHGHICKFGHIEIVYWLEGWIMLVCRIGLQIKWEKYFALYYIEIPPKPNKFTNPFKR